MDALRNVESEMRTHISLLRVGTTKAHRVRGANLPQEYELARFVQNISNLDPSWNTSTHACDWKGVNCDAELHVSKIMWMFMGLSGSLEWNYLCRTLREFAGWDNKFTGSIAT